MPTNRLPTLPAPAMPAGGGYSVGGNGKVDLGRDYVAGGQATYSPLGGQVELSKIIDDLQRDLGINVYDAMLLDATVFGAFMLLACGILAGTPRLTPAVVADPGETPDSKRQAELDAAVECRDLCQRSLDRLNKPVKALALEFLYAIVYCCKLAEIVCESTDEDAVALKAIRVKPNASWAFVVNGAGDVIAVRCNTLDGGLADLPPEKFCWFAWLARDGDPRGRSQLRSAYNGWNLKTNLWPRYFKYLDKFGSPQIIGIAAPDAPDEVDTDVNGNEVVNTFITPTEALLKAIVRMEGGGGAAFRAGTQVTTIQASGSGEAFAAAFDRLDLEITKAILTSPRAMLEAQHGSKADSENANDNLGQLQKHGRESLSRMFEDHLFHRLILWNRGKADADKYTPTLEFGPEDSDEATKLMPALVPAGYQIHPSQIPYWDAKLGAPPRPREAVEAAGAAHQQGLQLAQQGQGQSPDGKQGDVGTSSDQPAGNKGLPGPKAGAADAGQP